MHQAYNLQISQAGDVVNAIGKENNGRTQCDLVTLHLGLLIKYFARHCVHITYIRIILRYI